MATVLSQVEGLLVVREQRAILPDLTKQGGVVLENVMVVSQLEGESHENFCSRVLGRSSRELGRGHSLRAATVSIEANADTARVELRRRMLQALVATLVPWPAGELVILAPANVGAEDRIRLFELVEATTRAAPMLNVRLALALEQRHECPLRLSLRRARGQVQEQPSQANRNGGYE
jgi:hypothetical protein